MSCIKVQTKHRESAGKCGLECTNSVDKSVDKVQESVANVAHFLLAKCGKSVGKVQERCRKVQQMWRIFDQQSVGKVQAKCREGVGKCSLECTKSVDKSVGKVQEKSVDRVQEKCSPECIKSVVKSVDRVQQMWRIFYYQSVANMWSNQQKFQPISIWGSVPLEICGKAQKCKKRDLVDTKTHASCAPWQI